MHNFLKYVPGPMVVALLCCLILGFADSRAQSSSLWGDLESGPYGIGFMTLEEFDYSRSFQPKYSYNGELLPGERSRPIQVCIWYPAEIPDDAEHMVYGEYVYPYPGNHHFDNFIANMQNKELRFLHGLLNNDRAKVQDLLNVKVTAVRDAPPAEGKFPLIIYHANSMAGFAENHILCEYLAGQGYVVATTHSMGAREYIPQPVGGDIEAMTRDKEFVAASIRDLEFVDIDRLGLLGCGFGGLTALIMQMRNREANAVAVLEGSFMYDEYVDLSGRVASYNPEGLLMPLFVIYGNDPKGRNLSALDSYRYADIYTLGIDGLTAPDFCNYSRLAAFADNDVPVEKKRAYNDICRHLLAYYDSHLKKEGGKPAALGKMFESGAAAPVGMTVSYRDGLDRPPREHEFMAILRDEGGARGVKLYEKFKKQEPDYQIFREAMMNAVGYELLQTGRIEDALEVFRLNSIAYPGSANCWDSYAEALIATGDTETAMKCYRKVLEVLPTDSTSSPQMKQNIERIARERLGLNEPNDESN